jgi:type I restriction enzyme, S subunit
VSTVASLLQDQSPTTSGIPRGWAWARVEDILVPGSPVVYGILQPGPDTPGGVPYIRPTEIDGDVIQVGELRRTVPTIAAKYKRSEVREGDVILTIVGTIGKVAIVPDGLDGANITQSSSRLRADSRVLSSRYLAWTMRSPALRGQFDKLRLGTAVPRLNIAHVRDLLVPIAPPSEQHRIVAKIEELFSDLDAGVAALERVRANLKRYRAAVLKAAVEGRLTEEWRTRRPATEPAAKLLERILAERCAKWEQDQLRKFKEAGKTPPKGWKEKYAQPLIVDADALSALPTGWTWATVDACAWEVTVGHVGPMKDRYQQTGVPFLRSQNVRPLRYDREGLKYVPKDFHADLAKSRLLGGELLVVRSGNVGETCVYPTDAGEANCSDLVITRLLDAMAAPYVAIFVSSPTGRRSVLGMQTGSALPHFNVGAMERSPIPVPPLAEQSEIVAEVDRRLSVADAAEKQVEHALLRAARLRQAILRRAFEGNLVEQDPTDEPVAALLEQIKAGGGAGSNGYRAATRNKDNGAATPTKSRSCARA